MKVLAALVVAAAAVVYYLQLQVPSIVSGPLLDPIGIKAGRAGKPLSAEEAVKLFGTSKRVLIPLPDEGMDPSELSVVWKILHEAGHRIIFATPSGRPSQADQLVLNEGMVFGLVGKAFPEPAAFYRELEASYASFQRPISYADVKIEHADALYLVGGHAPGMVSLLNSDAVRTMLNKFWALGKPIGGVCHGVLLPARAGLLKSRKFTAVPKYLEWQAYVITRYVSGHHPYQLSTTWPDYVEDIVDSPTYQHGPYDILSPLMPGTNDNHRRAFIVEDGNLLTGRYWGDVYLLGQRFAAMLKEEDSLSEEERAQRRARGAAEVKAAAL
eukprot:gnl/Hemi2/11165_TR3856_c0_g1_i1.p1 gnl/Hemi2/11165_TR3856_c0_g1~~gnl/Hemi2/11165_TR3856_c0_g1_i1.p1  ORF type:complete len:327 (+),score=94.45 gnl/Hemi2/11165_TR3856_c0_g1_i1:51-1031(+)